MIYTPRCGMCKTCVNALRDCSGLDFKFMPVIEALPTVTVVRPSGSGRAKEVKL